MASCQSILPTCQISGDEFHGILEFRNGTSIWRFPKIFGYPQSSSISIGFSVINKPFSELVGCPHGFYGTPSVVHQFPRISPADSDTGTPVTGFAMRFVSGATARKGSRAWWRSPARRWSAAKWWCLTKGEIHRVVTEKRDVGIDVPTFGDGYKKHHQSPVISGDEISPLFSWVMWLPLGHLPTPVDEWIIGSFLGILIPKSNFLQ